MAHRHGDRQPADHVQHAVVQPPVPRHRSTDGFDVGAEHGKRRALFRHAGLVGLACPGARRRLHQAADLRGLVGEVVLHDQAAQALQQRDEVHHLAVVAGGPQRQGDAAGTLDARDELVQRGRTLLVQRAGPRAQRQRGTAHAFQAQHRDRAAHGEHRAVARHLTAAHLRRVHRAQQFERQRQVVQHHVGQRAGVLRLHQRQPRRLLRRAWLRRQHAGGAQLVLQQRQRPAGAASLDLQPTFQRAGQRARVAVALALLAVGGAVGDGAQRLGQRLRQRPGQAHDLAAQRRQAVDDLAGVGFIERRRADQHLVQQDAQRQHVALGGIALGAQRAGLDTSLVDRCLAGHFQARQAHAALVVQQQQVGLQVVVTDAALVRERQAFGSLHDLRGGVDGRHALARQAVGQRGQAARVVGSVGPAVLHADLDRGCQRRVVQARGTVHGLRPALHGGRAHRLHARQHDEELGAGLAGPAFRLHHQPSHRARTLAQQAQQLVAAEHAHGLWPWRSSRVVRGDLDRHITPIGTPQATRRCTEQRRKAAPVHVRRARPHAAQQRDGARRTLSLR